MSAIDWTIIGLYLIWIVWDGIRLSRDTTKLEGYFLASKSLPWWAVGLSVMATQLSAITMVSSTVLVTLIPSTTDSTTAGAEITTPSDMLRDIRNRKLVRLRVLASKRRSRYS